jgi:peptidoglycan lytic transglycosylase G
MKWILRLLVLAFVAGGFLAWRVLSPYQGFSGEKFVEIPRGTSTQGVARLLAENGIVRTPYDFLLARYTERRRVLQAGEYRFQHAASAVEVFDRIARGDVFAIELVVPEGKNMFDIAAAAEQLGLFPAAEFLKAARNPALIRDLDSQAPTLEGYLFPNSYKLGRKTTPERLCQIMTGKFREVWKGLEAGGDVHRIVTLASLVEKEGKKPEERPKIAAVFANRLRIGMKLDCDPTTIYAALLAGRYNGVIHRSDLDSDDPYNTYRNPGLPPGPIANPGVASLEAAIHPADIGAIYFVLRPDGSGTHQFSDNISDHEKATAQYRKSQQK